MEISFVSSLTPEDEGKFAAAFLAAITGMLEILPVAYSIRVKTTSGQVLDRTHAPDGASESRPAGMVAARLAALRSIDQDGQSAVDKLARAARDA